MGSTRAEGRTAGAVPRAEADLVDAAAALRWARPDLTAELADHVLEEALAGKQQDRWLDAAGWALHARAATGDGRDIACRLVAALPRWGSEALAGSSANRLRIELAMVAAGAGEVEFARWSLAGVSDDGDPELAADLLCAHARCAVEDAPDEVMGVLDAADAAWATVGGAAAELGGASVALIRAVVERRAGRPEAAVDHAAAGLGRLERGRTGSGSPSGHLAAALAAEWISALLDAGRATEAEDGCNALLPRLSEQVRPTRQLALLRLTVARALAAQDPRADTAQLLERAADDASGSDVPDLEAVCRTALGALYEQADRLEVALESLQLAVGAERRDRDRSRRFTAALAELPAESVRSVRSGERSASATAGDSESTTALPAITRGDRKLRSDKQETERTSRGSGERRRDDGRAGRRRNGTPAEERATSRFERMLEEDPVTEAEPAADDERSATWNAVPWNGSAGDSPIGDLLIHSLRAGSTEHADGPAGRRNGRIISGSTPPSDSGPAPGSRNGRAPGSEATDPPASGRAGRRRAAEPSDAPSDAPSGWLPSLDSDRAGERGTQGRRRGRSGDAERRRIIRSDAPRDDRDEATSTPPRSRDVESVGYADDPLVGTDDVESPERAGRRSSDRRQGSRRRSRRDDTRRDDTRGDDKRGDDKRADDARRDDDIVHGRHGRPGGSDGLDGMATTDRFTRGRDERTAGREVADEEDDLFRGTPADGGTRRPVDDPWPTDRWSVRQQPRGAADPVPADDTIEPDTGGDSGGWLQSALAELDRALSGIGLGQSAGLEDQLRDDGCSVIVDIARDGRRFAGPRAAAVVRSISDLLADRLPAGARSGFGDSDTLVITAPGWRRSDATDWMHRTLPALLDGFVATEDLPGAQLRVAVHDADGPVGAQILQHLSPQAGSREREASEERRRADERDRDPWADLAARDSEVRGRQYRAARAGRQERGAGSRSRREVESEPSERSADDDSSPRWPWSGADGQAAPEAPDPADEPESGRSRAREPDETAGWTNEPGSTPRHDSVPGRSTVSTRGENGGRGSRHRAGAQERTSGGKARGESTASGRASRRRREGRTGEEPTGTGAAGADASNPGEGRRRVGNDGRESERNGADRNGSVHDATAIDATAIDATAIDATAIDATAIDATATDATATDTAAVDAAPDPVADGSGRKADRSESTEGLGIADLLAGALAAYRGI